MDYVQSCINHKRDLAIVYSINLFEDAGHKRYLCGMTVEELEGYFEGIELPEQVELVQGVVIEDVPLFLASHFSYIKANPTLKSTDVFLHRLHQLQNKLEEMRA